MKRSFLTLLGAGVLLGSIELLATTCNQTMISEVDGSRYQSTIYSDCYVEYDMMGLTQFLPSLVFETVNGSEYIVAQTLPKSAFSSSPTLETKISDTWPSDMRIEEGSCQTTYPTSNATNSPAHLTSFKADTTFCAYFQLNDGFVTIEGTTQSTVNDDWLNNYTYTYRPNNTAPTITEGDTALQKSTNEDTALAEFTLNATDADDDTLTWSIETNATNGVATISNTPIGLSQAINYSPDGNYSGSDSFTVQVSDGNGGTDTIVVNVTINPMPDAPTVTSTPVTSVTQDNPYSYTLTGTDVDGENVAWSVKGGVENLPSWLTLDIKENELSTLLDLDTSDSNRLRVVASDNDKSIYFIYASEVKKYNIETKQTETIIDSTQGLNYPTDLAVALNGDLYIADKWNNAIKKWDGTTLSTVANVTSLQPDKIAIDSSENVYMISQGTQCSAASIKKWDGSSVSDVLSNADLGSCLHTIAVDSEGDLYFSHMGGGLSPNSIVKKYDVSESSFAPDINITLTNDIGEIMINANDMMYINGYDNSAGAWQEVDIYKYDIASTELTEFIPKEKGLVEPNGITFSPNGNVYIAEYGNDRLVGFSSATSLLGTPTSDDVGVHDVNLTLSDGTNETDHNFQITVHSNAPTVISTPITTIDVNSQYNYVLEAIDAQGDDLNWSIKSNTDLPSWLTLSGGGAIEDIDTWLSLPLSVAVDDSGNVYFSDASGLTSVMMGQDLPAWHAPLIKKYNATDGTVSTLLDKDDGLMFPTAVTLDEGGNLYFAELGNNSIKKYNIANGTTETIFSDESSAVYGMTLDSNMEYLYFTADTQNDSIKRCSLNDCNSTVETLIENDGGDNFISGIRGIAIDESGTVYFADMGNNAIKTWDSTNGLQTIVDTNLSEPNGIALHNDTLYIADGNNYMLKKYNVKTQEISVHYSTVDGQWGDYLLDVAVDSDGNSYISTFTEGSYIRKVPAPFKVSGTPTVAGIYDVNLTLSDGTTEVDHSFTITVPGELAITPSISKGTTNTATKITYTPSSVNKLKYMFSNSSITTPNYGDSTSDILGLVDYTSGTNIENAESGKYLVVYEVDSDGNIVGFYQEQLEANDIYSVDEPVVETPLPKLIASMPDQLVDINDTQKFDFNVTGYFENVKNYEFEEVKSDHNISDWLYMHSGTGVLTVRDGYDHKASLLNPGKYYIQVNGYDSDDNHAKGYFTLRVKNLAAGLSEYITKPNDAIETKGDDFLSFAKDDSNATVYSDGSAKHIIKDVAQAESKLPDSKVTISDNGDVNTSTSTINNDGQTVDIEVLGKVNDSDGVKAQHSLTLEDGNTTKATSKVPNTKTTIRTDRVVETNATAPNNAQLSVKAYPDGKAEHTVSKEGEGTSKATVELPGGETTIQEDGTIDTSYKPSDDDGKNGCGDIFEAVVETDEDGNTLTKFRDIDNAKTNECAKSPTLANDKKFPIGSESNITTLGDNKIHILTTTPALGNNTQFTVE
jgi:sugar lactone lactonase YvrE